MEEHFANYGLINELTFHISKTNNFYAGFAIIQFLNSLSVVKCLQEEKHIVKNMDNINVRRLISNEELTKRKRELDIEGLENNDKFLEKFLNFLDNLSPALKRSLVSVSSSKKDTISDTAKGNFYYFQF